MTAAIDLAPPVPFDSCGPLPAGTVVLEASAGTGKTFTIAALTARYVAEAGVPLAELMLVTFGRAATQELRERVRERLVVAERGLANPASARCSADELLRLLASVPDEEVAARRARLARALAEFDAATIATTHGFCSQILAGLGLGGDTGPDVTFAEDVDDLIREVVDDLYLRKFAGGGVELLGYDEALRVARQALGDPYARLEPAAAAPDTTAGLRRGLAEAARREVARRKRQRGLLDYDDLLTELRDVLVDARRGPAAKALLRRRYRVVLVDEFQDTDPVQWQILREAFAGSVTLVLIGDPKQAIYGFRGADVVTYLAASGTATSKQTLARNWRSDRPLLAAVDRLFGGAALGDPRIVVRPVEAAHETARLTGPPGNAPLRIRVLGRGADPNTVPGVRELREQVADDLAADVVRLLGAAPAWESDRGSRPVQPGDVAVLVRRNDQARLVREALRAASVPAVVAGSSSVFLAPVARDWLVLLQALEQPHRAGLVRAAALTRFVGWTAEQLAAAGESAWDELGPRMRGWAELLARRGVAALVQEVGARQRLAERLLTQPHGERDLTDLRHIGDVLHAAAVEGSLGVAALVEWLQQRIDEAERDVTEERSRRLESDAAAVQIVTVHRSKGLEFPLVYVPFAWDRFVDREPEPLRLHDADGTRVLDVGGPTGPGYAERRDRFLAEEGGEDLRLFYVAVTRAKSAVVTWWAPSKRNTACSALHRLLFADRTPDGQLGERASLPSDAAVRARLDELAAGSGGTIAVEPVDAVARKRWSPPVGDAPPLSAASFDRVLDLAWRRTSYSALTVAAHAGEEPVGSEPEERERVDEPALAAPGSAVPAGPADDDWRAVVSPLGALPTGTAFGTLVHEVLETVEPTPDHLTGELASIVADSARSALARRLAPAVEQLDADQLAAGLVPVLRTPLGPLADGRTLADFPRSDRLAELAFELPLAGGDEAGIAGRDPIRLAAVAALLRRHLPADDPLADYPDLLGAPALASQPLRGYLTGSIDAVLRCRPQSGAARYLVVDYKTNWLAPFPPGSGEELTPWHYRPAALREAMLHAHYPLQALLYVVALHRFLRWRQPGYDPAVQLGGVLYLFLRGMCGPTTPTASDGTPAGVFGWRPPPELVLALSDLLDGQER